MWNRGETIERATNLDRTQRQRWAVTDATLRQYRKLGAQWNLIILRQGIDGQHGFSRAKRAVQVYRDNGISPVFRILAGSSLYSHLRRGTPDSYGYNRRYYAWIRSIAKAFQHSVRFYLIGNELDHGLGPNLLKFQRKAKGTQHVSYSQYLKVLTTAAKAIRSVNPNLIVVDYGISGFTLGAATAQSLIISGHPIAAASYWERLHYNRIKGSSLLGLIHLLSRPAVRAQIQFVENTFRNPGPCDFIQFHYYGGASALPETISWMRKMAEAGGQARPLFAGEIGYLVPGPKNFGSILDNSSQAQMEQAAELVKDLATVLGSGISHALYWYARNWLSVGNVAPLFKTTSKPEDFVPFAAAGAYRVLSHALNGLTAAPGPMITVPGVRAYSFSGADRITIVWSEGAPRIMDLRRYPGIAKIRTMMGDPIGIPANKKLPVADSPTYIYWKSGH